MSSGGDEMTYHGGNEFHLRSQSSQRDLCGRVREAVRQDAVFPHYQPIVDIETEEPVAIEALARWTHPLDASIGPEQFIPAAESGGFIGDLFFQMLRRVCVDGLRWDPAIRIAVNVSPHQFHDPFLAKKILSVLERTGFPAERLEIEVTEGNPLLDWSRAVRTLETLKLEGARFALDDFGTGYANLGHLRELPFDTIKIDRSFVHTLLGRKENQTIVRSMIALGRDLDLTVVAEGIETVEQMEWLREAGCRLSQGHYFCYPLPAEELDDLLFNGVPAE